MLSPYSALRNLLRTRLVLAPPEPSEDGRVLQLFRNRAELKKVYGQAQEEIHRLRDRIKLQEGATVRVKELLTSLESRLAVPASGLQALVHYQLRALWSVAQARIGALVRELAVQREDHERRAHMAEQNRRMFDAHQLARRALADAEYACADVREKLAAVQKQLASRGAWWHYFARKSLQRRRHAMQAELGGADIALQGAREQVERIEREGVTEYPGLSLEARRAINRVAVAYAHLIMLRLAPTGMLEPATNAMLRSEPNYSAAPGDGPQPLAMMNEIAKARAIIQAYGGAALEVKQLADQLRDVGRYAEEGDTTPAAESLDVVLLARAPAGATPGAATLRQNVLREDLFGLSSVLL